MKNKRIFNLLFIVVLLILIFPIVNAYNVESGEEVHQYLTNESKAVWEQIPFEIKNHSTNSITRTSSDNGYNQGDDIIDGSREEDLPIIEGRFLRHFWQPDSPDYGDYDIGLGQTFQSSWARANGFWKTKIIDNYLKGNINESYYWLGRVAHLLEDAAQPSHVLLDPHVPLVDSSILEDYTGDNFNTLKSQYNWTGKNFNPYYYENLISSFDWSKVEPDKLDYLFRLFWYTAQKTQYWASDDVDGNTIYRELDDTPQNWACSGTGSTNLWRDFGFTSCSDFVNTSVGLTSNTVSKEANATIPHAMKATAGLYRLFLDTVNSYSWPTYHHDNKRAGFTLLKGDADSTNSKNDLDFVVKNVPQDSGSIARYAMGDIDGNEGMEVIIVNSENTDKYIYAVGKDSQTFLNPNPKTREKWKNPFMAEGAALIAPPTLADTYGDKKLEIFFGLENGTLYKLNSDGTRAWTYTVPAKFSTMTMSNRIGNLGYTAVEDLDNNGVKEIIFIDGIEVDYTWPGDLYILHDNGNSATLVKNISIGSNGGGVSAPAIADLDEDGDLEIAITEFYGLRVYNYNSGILSQSCNVSAGKTGGSPVIYDIDYDNDYEIVFATHTCSCNVGSCFDKIIIKNATACIADNSNSEITVSSLEPRVTPSIANLDTDENPEIVINGETSCGSSTASLRAYDPKTDSQEWNYDYSPIAETTAPNIADIDGDGNYNILAANTTGVIILNNDGTLDQAYRVLGTLGNSPIIGDIDNDRKAELAVTRQGSPITLLTLISSGNKQPVIAPLDNLTGIAGELININKSGQLTAFDQDGDSLTYSYGGEFNGSGLWQTTSNDTGNYSILVEVSDGNLSDFEYIDLKIFNENSTRQENFTTGNKASLIYTSTPENKTVQVRLPKNATILYSRIKVSGSN
ncbi:MAG TPA: FG-GAP-like repeat-containing protein [Candidatus Nanoarchaeia archaeon]|nr:FG-GAP-like repeat-containing protein [Candidatus Nanoarchaeia archaeon]